MVFSNFRSWFLGLSVLVTEGGERLCCVLADFSIFIYLVL